MSPAEPEPCRLDVADEVLDDLRPRLASLLDNALGARDVGLALLRVDRDVSGDDDHVSQVGYATMNV